MIPGFGNVSAECTLWQNYSQTFGHAFTSSALLWNLTFNFGYYFAYMAACHLNKHDALIGVSASTMVTCLVTAISYPIPALTPDTSVVAIGLVPLTIVLSFLAFYIYTVWSEKMG